MEKAKVYFTDFRARAGMNVLQKLDRLVREAGIENIDSASQPDYSENHIDITHRSSSLLLIKLHRVQLLRMLPSDRYHIP